MGNVVDNKTNTNDGRLLGDIVADTLQKVNADKIAAALEKITKKPCNCGKRREQLNRLHQKITGKKSK